MLYGNMRHLEMSGYILVNHIRIIENKLANLLPALAEVYFNHFLTIRAKKVVYKAHALPSRFSFFSLAFQPVKGGFNICGLPPRKLLA